MSVVTKENNVLSDIAKIKKERYDKSNNKSATKANGGLKIKEVSKIIKY